MINRPRLDRRLAVQMRRKTAWRSGDRIPDPDPTPATFKVCVVCVISRGPRQAGRQPCNARESKLEILRRHRLSPAILMRANTGIGLRQLQSHSGPLEPLLRLDPHRLEHPNHVVALGLGDGHDDIHRLAPQRRPCVTEPSIFSVASRQKRAAHISPASNPDADDRTRRFSASHKSAPSSSASCCKAPPERTATGRPSR